MQKNALAVVAVAGSCAVLYILYRFKYFSSEKTNCIAAEDKTMGKSNECTLSGGKENMYGTVTMNNTSVLQMKSDKMSMNKSLTNSKKNSKNKKFHENHITPMLCPVNFDIENSGNEFKKSVNNRSNLDLLENATVPNLEMIENSLENCDLMENKRNDSKCNLAEIIRYEESDDTFEPPRQYLRNNFNTFDVIYVPNNNNEPPSLKEEFENSMMSESEQTDVKENVENNENDADSNFDAQLNSNIIKIEELNRESDEISTNDEEISISRVYENTSDIYRREDSKSKIVLESTHFELENFTIEKEEASYEPKRLDTHENGISLQFPNSEIMVGVNENLTNFQQNCIVETLGKNEIIKNDHSPDQFITSINKNLEPGESIANGNHSCENSTNNLCNCDNNSVNNSSSNDEKAETDTSTGPSVRPKTKKSRRRKSNQANKDSSNIEETTNLSRSFSSSFDSTCSESMTFCVKENTPNPEKQIPTTSELCDKSEVNEISDPDFALNAFYIYLNQNRIPDFMCYQFEVPQILVGRLIGKGGNFIKKIKSETNAKVVLIPSEYNRDVKICNVEGVTSEVREAFYKIRAHFPVEDFPELTLQPLSPIPQMKLPHQFTESNMLTRGETLNVKFSAFCSSGEIWFHQPSHNTDILYEGLRMAMNIYYHENKNVPSLDLPILKRTVGVCMLKDNNWERCMVMSHTANDAEVQLMDTGEEITVPLKNLKKLLLPDYAILNVQAASALFYSILPIKGNEYTEEARLFLIEMLKNKSLLATVNAFTIKEKPCIELFISEDKKHISVNEELVKKGFAKKVNYKWEDVIESSSSPSKDETE